MRNPVRCTLMSLTMLLAFGTVALGQDTLEPGGTTPAAPAAAPAADGTQAPAPAAAPAEDGVTTADPATTGAGGAGGKKEEPKGPFDNATFLIIMVGMIVLMYVWMGRSKKKQANKRKEMLANLRKGDKVRSIGGILGTAVEVRETEVVVKIDENAGTRIHFAREAISAVGDDAKKSSDEANK